MRTYRYMIPGRYGGAMLQDYLRQEHGFSRRIMIRLKRQEGNVLRNGTRIRMIDRLNEGDEVTVILESENWISPNSALSVPVVYEDDDLIVFDKPAGMPVHPSPGHRMDTLANFYASHLKGKGETAGFHPINRLDRDTMGLCVTAKNPLCAKKLSESLQKRYSAVLFGELPELKGTICAPIGREPKSIIKRCVREDGQYCKTNYRVLARGGGYTVVSVRLETGRTHQIRVHFAYLGYPLVGDTLYGCPVQERDGQALVCDSISFPHPVTGKETAFCVNIREVFGEYFQKIQDDTALFTK